MPEKLDSCVKQVKSEGKTEESAYAICNDSIKSGKEGHSTLDDLTNEEAIAEAGHRSTYSDYYKKKNAKNFKQNPDFPEPSIDIVTKKKKKTGFHSLMNTKIASMKKMLKKTSQTGSCNLEASLNTLLINNMKLQVRPKNA